MTWYVIQNANGELQLIQIGEPIPEGWVLVAVTANPDYLNYMDSLPQ